jgi:hypothetical protein
MKSPYLPHGLRCDSSLFPHLRASFSDEAYSRIPPLTSCKIFLHQYVKGRESRVNRHGITAMVKRELAILSGHLQLLTRPSQGDVTDMGQPHVRNISLG